jgi:nitrate reductase beta subunit
MDYRVALPLHPEYRTMPMVWYIPPLSPVVDALRDSGHDAEDAGNLFGAIDALRIPIEYLANLFTAGDVRPVRESLDKLAAMRSYMRDLNLGRDPRPEIAEAVGMTGPQVQEMFRLLAIAKYDERYVIPTTHAEQGHALEELGCSLDVDGGPGMSGVMGALGEGAGKPIPVAIATFAEAKARQQADTMEQADEVDYRAWDGSPMPGMAGHQGGNTSPGAER